ncbi:hypothetical protein D3C73_1062720 [compost metagenome]
MGGRSLVDSSSSFEGGIPSGQERMIGVERQAIHAAALDGDAFASSTVQRIGLDRVTGRAQGAQPIHHREGRPARCDGDDVVNVLRFHLPAAPLACLAQWALRQLGLAQALPPGG